MPNNKLKEKVEALTRVVQQLIKEVQRNATVAQGTLSALQISLGKEDSLDKEIKKLESAAQTPFEKGKRRKRMQQSRAHRVS